MSFTRLSIMAAALVLATCFLVSRANAFCTDCCNEGGAGASDCSLEQGSASCSVSCSPGSYACCQYDVIGPSCACISET